MASGRARARVSKISWARASGSARLGPTPTTVVCSRISHLPRRVPPPARSWWNVLALHEESVAGEHGAVTHRDAVVGQRADAERAAGADRRVVAFERAVLLRVALDLAAVVEDALVPDRRERRLGALEAAVEKPSPDPHPHQPPEHVLARRAIERVQIVNRKQLPQALDRPEIGVVDGANGWPHRVHHLEATLHQREEHRGDHHAE